ncbi:MAG: hypothetical protein JWP85_1001 [Rhodoglobus sp.]|nr:hypothetical protein [Rhodoglobus sp.]
MDHDRPAPVPIAYSINDAARAIGQSVPTIKRAIAKGDLTPRYPNSKPIILHEDLLAWARALPVERP